MSIHAHHPACPLSDELKASLPPADAIHADFNHFPAPIAPPTAPSTSSSSSLKSEMMAPVPVPVPVPPPGTTSSSLSMPPPFPKVVGGKPIWRPDIKSPTGHRLQTLMQKHPQPLDEHPYIHYKSLFNPFVHSFQRDCVPVFPVSSSQLFLGVAN